MQKPNLVRIKNLVNSKKSIAVDNHFIRDTLGFEDMRDFSESLHSFGYTTDFTYMDHQTNSWQLFIRRYLKDTFLD